MQLYSVEILNEEAIVLLQGLERLKAIRLIPYGIKKKKETTDEQPQKDLGEKYAGRISPELADKINLYIQHSRDEWQEPIF